MKADSASASGLDRRFYEAADRRDAESARALGTQEAGANDMRYDNDKGHPNSYVYDIEEVVDAHTLRLHMPAKVDEHGDELLDWP